MKGTYEESDRQNLPSEKLSEMREPNEEVATLSCIALVAAVERQEQFRSSRTEFLIQVSSVGVPRARLSRDLGSTRRLEEEKAWAAQGSSPGQRFQQRKRKGLEDQLQ